MQVLGGRGFLCDDDQTELPRYQRNRFEIIQHVVLQRVKRTLHDVRAPDADHERVTVGRRARDPAYTDAASRAGHIFNDDRLAERRPHALDQDATDDIRRPTWREWDNDCDGPRRIGLRPSD